MVRTVTQADEVFLRALYAEHRTDLTALDLDHKTLATLLDFQWRARRTGYAALGAVEWAVLVADEPVGHLITSRDTTEHRLVDLVIAHTHRRRGVGRALVVDAIAEAGAAAVPVRVSIARDNTPSYNMCVGLGFEIVGENELDFFLERRP
jgi:predicted GNAT superfamily acetyltransferase